MPPFVSAQVEPAGPTLGQAELQASVTWVLRPAASSAQTARRQVGAQLEAWGLRHLVDNAELIISELVTNAFRHGSKVEPVWHTMRRISTDCGDVIRLEVGDCGGGGSGSVPARREVVDSDADGDELLCSGRGLCLVEAVSSDWGVWRLPHGHVVWAVLPAGEVDPGMVRAEELPYEYGLK
ncbi:anti-sigma regulatory factor (Ser/Thr protein kinase) [Streptomyces sp. V4I23]|uniref:ATP-binding protein n=1 Tax=Streptomyces sp. V4I23 TaxID=3042282 RepID=UPI00277E551D|nr:ATP-binding protein [Streptomyces sp. V4I23]MDQ1012412.1 anti-sigma regulatory factor (Ser/Thr protein kinase) [Streptomyces sp. V4I23]